MTSPNAFTIEIDGCAVHVATGGAAFDGARPCVVFLHGSGGDCSTWAGQLSALRQKGYCVIAPDLPGHGRSGGPALKNIEQSGVWLSKLLDDIGVSRAHFAGHSQGFLTALSFASVNAARVQTLTAIASAATIRVNPALIETAKQSASKAADMMCKWGFGPAAHEASTNGSSMISECHAVMSTAPLAEDLQACADFNMGSQIAKSLNVSSCCILARHDKMTPLKAGEALAADLGCTPVILDGHGHMLPIEAPDETLDALEHFLGGLTS